MCGRYTLKAPREAIAEAFDLADVPELLPRYNIAPTQPVPVVRLDRASGEREIAHPPAGGSSRPGPTTRPSATG